MSKLEWMYLGGEMREAMGCVILTRVLNNNIGVGSCLLLGH